MATMIERGQAIGNALINGTATLSQLNRLGRALAYREARSAEYDAADNNGKATIYVEAFRAYCMRALKEFESIEAAQDAKDAAAAVVDTDFTPTP